MRKPAMVARLGPLASVLIAVALAAILGLWAWSEHEVTRPRAEPGAVLLGTDSSHGPSCSEFVARPGLTADRLRPVGPVRC